MSRAGIILTNLEQMMFEYALRFAFSTSNNEAEYEALVTGLVVVKRTEEAPADHPLRP